LYLRNAKPHFYDFQGSDTSLATQLRQESYGESIPRENITVMIGGQGGDGTLTVVSLLGHVFRNIGLNIYDARNVLSRIRGGHADGLIRASVNEIYSVGDHVDVLVAFDEEAVKAASGEMSDSAVIVYDDSKGKLSDASMKPGYKVYSAPLGNLVANELRRNIYKNTAAFAIVGRILGLEDELLLEVLRARYEKRGKESFDANIRALQIGLSVANEKIKTSSFRLARKPKNDKILSTGNEAAAFGFLVAGGRFFVGYPITPATDIMEWLAPRLPKFGGVVKQAEDELAVINMGIGAACAGARVMVATSGPGQSLMTEGVGHAGEAEVPIVVVECQRVGPSTGEPTKNEQSDLNHIVYGSHGEFPRIVIAPGTPSECFYETVRAMNLAEKYQLPVFLMLDQALCQNSTTIDPFDISQVAIDRGKLLDSEQLSKLEVYKRYEFTDDGVSPRSIPSQEGGQFQVTGNEHNEFGLVSVDKTNRLKMMRKRMLKLEVARKDLPKANIWGPNKAKIGIIGFGSSFGPIMESMKQLESDGHEAKFLQIKTIWPLLEDEIQAFLDLADVVFVVENNYQGQLANLIRSAIGDSEKIQGITKFDGSSFKPIEITRAITSFLDSKVIP
jgi:2-oxoglutarate ferredoxin oxidoreductase subunit alpha